PEYCVRPEVDPSRIGADHGEIVARVVECRAFPFANAGIGERIVGTGRRHQDTIAEVQLDGEPLPVPAGVRYEEEAWIHDAPDPIRYSGVQPEGLGFGAGWYQGACRLVVDREEVVGELDDVIGIHRTIGVGRRCGILLKVDWAARACVGRYFRHYAVRRAAARVPHI